MAGNDFLMKNVIKVAAQVLTLKEKPLHYLSDLARLCTTNLFVYGLQLLLPSSLQISINRTAHPSWCSLPPLEARVHLRLMCSHTRMMRNLRAFVLCGTRPRGERQSHHHFRGGPGSARGCDAEDSLGRWAWGASRSRDKYNKVLLYKLRPRKNAACLGQTTHLPALFAYCDFW